MAIFSYSDLDMSVFQDFKIEYTELFEVAEKSILKLEESPQDEELLNGLFRAVHTVKGNCGFLGIMPLVEILQELESILDIVRNHELSFESVIGDITLLVLDQCTLFIDEISENKDTYYDDVLLSKVSSQINKAVLAQPNDRLTLLARALLALNPAERVAVEKVNELEGQSSGTYDDDLEYIQHLAVQTQMRAPFWVGRLERILTLVNGLNDYCDQPVEPKQLYVAACLHEIGMSMLPSKLINKDSRLSNEEKLAMQDHVWVASRLASSFPEWHEAKIILDQHHESFDGSGYPIGLEKESISIGAQMLAIVHTIEAITHGYSRSLSRKRPLMYAISELIRFSGSQFNPEWVAAFIESTRVNSHKH